MNEPAIQATRLAEHDTALGSLLESLLAEVPEYLPAATERMRKRGERAPDAFERVTALDARSRSVTSRASFPVSVPDPGVAIPASRGQPDCPGGRPRNRHFSRRSEGVAALARFAGASESVLFHLWTLSRWLTVSPGRAFAKAAVRGRWEWRRGAGALRRGGGSIASPF